MFIADNIISQKLDNVFFIVGSSCAGKTTAASELKRKYGFYCYSSDAMRTNCFKLANYANQPALSRYVPDYEALTVAEALEWEKNIIREMTPMMIADLIELSGKYQTIVFEGDIDTESLFPLIKSNKAICLLTGRKQIVQDFFKRPDHAFILENIEKNAALSEREKQRRISKWKEIISGGQRMTDPDLEIPDNILEYGIKYYIRTEDSTVNDMMNIIEEHFGLPGSKI